MLWLCRADPAINLASIETTDGCNSWKLLFTNPDAAGFWDGLLFLDRQHGVIYGDPVQAPGRTDHVRFGLLVTHDGGKTWRPGAAWSRFRESLLFAASNSAMAASGSWIWLGTSKARVLRTKNLATWQSAQTPLASGNDSSGVFSLAFRDQMHGIAVGGDYRKPEEATGTAAYTSDGGEHWSVPASCPMVTVLPWPGTQETKPGSRWVAMAPMFPMTMARRGNGSIVVIGTLSACLGSSVPKVKLASWERFRPSRTQRAGVSR